ncbi:hypothetical protein MHI43_00940 [Paenibacillus sp. FSL H8-0457]|uniref:hypothetical protein n=1 Tax=unclassified Paenibacillus TaxID=185978 RepID=UPI0001788B4E|nr:MULTISPECIES: hypothetical protein [unclassified Paenibacillus]ACX62475.1 hypothetical protein GYMC10_0166 [Paenibacillus sp. Y412MC10]ETT63735.1 hypothetical protein C172_15564 [Paenibacillus sp. FSL H8-457]
MENGFVEEEIQLKGKILSISAIILGLLFISNQHLGYSFGDDLFRWAGISPWTKQGNYGLHLPVIAGLILLTIGILRVTSIYRPLYPKIMSRVMIGCIAWIVVFPFVSESVMFVANFNSSGISTVAYSKKDSNCEYRTENEVILARCQIQIYSYGTERQVTVRPLSVDVGGRVIDFEPKVVPVRPRGRIEIRETFDGFLDQPDPSYSMSGGTNKPGIELIVDGRSKQVK